MCVEKHKNYHMKDEQLNKDGFKKFMKHEPCGFITCKFSRTHNHIHCIRSVKQQYPHRTHIY
jgi:hypothetical protein